MKLTMTKDKKQPHSVELEAICPECHIFLDLQRIKLVNKENGRHYIVVKAICPKCSGEYRGVIRINRNSS